jgi:hypothetical protein
MDGATSASIQPVDLALSNLRAPDGSRVGPPRWRRTIGGPGVTVAQLPLND